MKQIIFNLKREWYDRIASGDPEPETGTPKLIEYREISEHWIKRFEIFPSLLQDLRDGSVMSLLPEGNWLGDEWFAVFRLGYSRKHPDIIRRISEIDIGPCPYRGWRGKFFRVHFLQGGSN